MSNSPWVVDIDGPSFQTEVVDRSKTLPVVVDFWAEWCQPCKTLGPVLERFAEDGNGRFLLAKIDIDKNPELAQVFGVQSIPAVLALRDGQIVDGFTGNVPTAAILEFLDKIAPELDLAEDPTVAAGELERAGDLAGAAELLASHVAATPGDTKSSMALARLYVAQGKSAEAQALFDSLDETVRTSPEGEELAAQLAFAESAGALEALQAAYDQAPDDLTARTKLGQALAAAGQHREGLEHLLEVVTADLHHDDDAARKAMLELFNILGPEHALSHEFRQRLQVVLF